jgi:hypothetical protein
MPKTIVNNNLEVKANYKLEFPEFYFTRIPPKKEKITGNQASLSFECG